MKERKKLPSLEDHNPLEPFNLDSLGSANDVCFGKSYDLTTKECKMCGDSELCALRMSQTLRITRKELEEKNKYKDLDVLEDTAGIKKYIRSLLRKGKSRKEILDMACHKYEVPRPRIRQIYKDIKK